MFKWFTQLFADDTYHIFEPGETKGFIKHVLKWTGLILFTLVYIVYAVVLEFIVRPAVRFAAGINAALRAE